MFVLVNVCAFVNLWCECVYVCRFELSVSLCGCMSISLILVLYFYLYIGMFCELNHWVFAPFDMESFVCLFLFQCNLICSQSHQFLTTLYKIRGNLKGKLNMNLDAIFFAIWHFSIKRKYKTNQQWYHCREWQCSCLQCQSNLRKNWILC